MGHVADALAAEARPDGGARPGQVLPVRVRPNAALALALALALAVALAAARDRRRGALELGEVAAGVAAEVLPRGRRRVEVRAPGGNARGGGVMTMMMRANG